MYVEQAEPGDRLKLLRLRLQARTVTYIYSPSFIREVNHDVNGRRQTAKITSGFEFFSSNP